MDVKQTLSNNVLEKNDSIVENIDKNISDMSDGEINALVNEVVPNSTKRSTAWGTKVFEKWLEKRNIEIDLHQISADDLALHLKKFYAEIKKKNGELYTPSALVGIRAAIHRTLINPPYMRNINILGGENFVAANRVFDAKCKIYVARGNPKPKHKPCISETDMTKLNGYFADHANDPTKLQEFVWFGLCYYFGRRGREGWRGCTSSSFICQTDEDGIQYITEGTTMTSKNRQGGSKVDDNDYSDPRLYNNEVITAYKLFLSKRNPLVSSLFQTPMKNRVPEDDVWYKNEPMGPSTIGSIMQRISKNARLSHIYTSHCVRASMITILYRGGVQPKEICGITKHKRESSLDSYIKGSSSKQKRQCSHVLSSALGLHVSGIFYLNKPIFDVHVIKNCLFT